MTRPLAIEAEPAFRTRHANPYNARLYTAVQSLGHRVSDLKYHHLLTRRVDVVHLHWPELTFLSGHRRSIVAARLVIFFGLLRFARLRGTRVIWTVHNVAAHETRSTPRLRARYRRLLLANVDGVIALTSNGVDAVRAAYPELDKVPAFVTPHGHYRDDYDFSIGREEARRTLGILPGERVVLSIGQIRPYKNVPALIRTFRALHPEGVRLVIAGKPSSSELAAEISAASDGDPSILVEPGFQSDERMALWLRASDLVVLPYSAIQNSGSAVLALSADRPVLVPDIGAMTELAELVGTPWVRTFSGELTGDVLADAVAWSADPGRPERADLSALDWTVIADQTVSAYEETTNSPRPGRFAPSPTTGRAEMLPNRLGTR